MPRHVIPSDTPASHTHDYTTGVSGKPSTFPPSTHQHDYTTDVTGKPATFAPSAHNHAAADINSGTLGVERATANITLTVFKSGGSWPARPTARADVTVQWVGAEPGPTSVSSGTGGMREGIDLRFITP